MKACGIERVGRREHFVKVDTRNDEMILDDHLLIQLKLQACADMGRISIDRHNT